MQRTDPEQVASYDGGGYGGKYRLPPSVVPHVADDAVAAAAAVAAVAAVAAAAAVVVVGLVVGLVVVGLVVVGLVVVGLVVVVVLASSSHCTDQTALTFLPG